jgi:glucose-6-phosphate-specific signal transduction histidine kinase
MKLYPDDWQIRLTTGVVSAICITAALIVVGFDRFWPLMLSLVVAIIVGNVLGRLVCRLLFRSSSGGPPEKEKMDKKK